MLLVIKGFFFFFFFFFFFADKSTQIQTAFLLFSNNLFDMLCKYQYQEDMRSVSDMDDLAYRFWVPYPFLPMPWWWVEGRPMHMEMLYYCLYYWLLLPLICLAVGGRGEVIALPFWSCVLSVFGNWRPPPGSMSHSTQCVCVGGLYVCVGCVCLCVCDLINFLYVFLSLYDVFFQFNSCIMYALWS